MHIITYDLRAGGDAARPFYDDLDTFSREVLTTIEHRAGDLLDDYGAFVVSRIGEAPRSRGEYGVELLSLGMLYRRYLGASQRTPRWILALLEGLWAVRRRHPGVKPAADWIRGRLAGRSLVPRIGTAPAGRRRDLPELTRLVTWLSAAGEFRDEVKRLRRWLAFLRSAGHERTRRAVDTAVALDAWFCPRADAALGYYTPNVNRFLANEHPRYRGREDEIFTGKEAAEYHLNMVASALMNRGLRDDFLETGDKVVLLPGCMRPDERGCRARRKGADLRCTGCSARCGVARITALGRRHGFRVVIVPHATSFSRILDRWQGRDTTGVVAAACLLNIAVGGYEMRERSIRSQCVLLDHCGCKKHWHDTGIRTDLSDEQLLKVLGFDPNQSSRSRARPICPSAGITARLGMTP